MKNKSIIAILLFVSFTLGLLAQVPSKPSSVRLVNDFADLYTPAEEAQLERFLVALDDSTSNQIVVVTLSDFGGYDAAYMATQIGEQWGVGGKEYNNGIVLLIKPKKGNQRGEVFIATGYGLEGAIPDAICNHITDIEMIPYFKQNDYFGGTVKGVKILAALAKGEIDEKRFKDNGFGKIIMAFIFIVLMIIFFFKNRKRNNNENDGHTTYRSPLPWIFLGGGFGGGSSSSGFGGFGGGSFGGGGAGGSW